MSRIWVLGEALIDFVPVATNDGMAYLPKPGGSPYNAAKAAAHAGAESSFLGTVSRDLFGEMLIADMLEYGVDCTHVPRTDDPTTLAFVNFEQGEPRYAFFNALSATAKMTPDPAHFHPAPSDILAIGSISLIDSPAAGNICRFVLAAPEYTMIALDPNARPGMISDMADWLGRIETLLDAASIIKLSREDLAIIRPDTSADDFARNMLDRGAGLVVVTAGPDSVMGYTGHGRVEVTPPVVDLCDTVGAGDTLMGAMLAYIGEAGLGTVEKLNTVGPDGLAAMLGFASAAAALNCTKSGCAPPTRAAIDEFNP